MGLQHMTPEERRAVQQKARETRARNRAERAAAAPADPSPSPIAAEKPPSLAELGLGTVEDLRVDDILTNEEIEEIKAQARAKVAEERRKSKRKIFMDLAMDEARRAAGTMPEDEERRRELDQITTIKINLPRLRLANGRECPPDPIIIDQRIFAHGRTYEVTVAQAEYLMDRVARAWEGQAQVDGRMRTYYNEQVGTMMYMGGTASGGTMASGLRFDAVHRRQV